MKFSEKIIWACLLTIVVVFSIGSTVMISQNHSHLLKTTQQQNISSHEIEIYSLESKLLQDSLKNITNYGYDLESMKKRAIYYIQQFEYSLNHPQVAYALRDENETILFSSLNQESLSNYSIHELDNYFMTKENGKHVMVLTSPIDCGNIKLYLTASYNISSCFRERTRQVELFFIIGACILLGSFIILRFLSRYLTQSIERLNIVSQHIANGNYHERTQIESDDEIGELSKSFDEMARVNEQRILELQQSLEQREEFMGSFSHEIKTPMTSILGYADMLRTYNCDDETRQVAAQYIYSEGKRLENLSYALMDLLSIGEREIKLVPTTVTTIIEQLKIYYQGKSVPCLLNFKCEDAKVISQEDLLFTVLRNLIDNAIKASSQNQQVIIKGEKIQGTYQFSIIDQGIGMSQEDIEKATEPFYMADKSRSRSQGGAGLGMSIVKRICDFHQTKLMIASHLQQGTVVSFELEVANNE